MPYGVKHCLVTRELGTHLFCLVLYLTFFLLFTPYGLGNEVKSITFASWSKPDVELFYVLPKEINKDTKVLFIIHGNSRGAERYLKLWISSSKNKNVILVAPHFSKQYFPRYSSKVIGQRFR